MEAEGYRRMAPSFDRPDVLSIFEVRIEGDKTKCPVLLSNGNKVASWDVEGSAGARHFAVWKDPFPKPSYLFAVVAGNLAKTSGTFTTRSGREVAIDIWCDAPDKVSELGHALESVKIAMKWDEEQFGREYDLDIFNVVAVADFNMGAMENKSLNVFNSKCVLGVPETATDATLRRIQGIIAHEYFHNWTGNRVTCRDWFQLTLKEGCVGMPKQPTEKGAGRETPKR
jgi:aminopeptidase N